MKFLIFSLTKFFNFNTNLQFVLHIFIKIYFALQLFFAFRKFNKFAKKFQNFALEIYSNRKTFNWSLLKAYKQQHKINQNIN